MAGSICTQGSQNSAGATIHGGYSNNVFINNQPAAIVGSVLTSCHQPAISDPSYPPHQNPTIASGSSSVMINNQPAVLTSVSHCSCGHIMSQGVSSVQIGN